MLMFIGALSLVMILGVMVLAANASGEDDMRKGFVNYLGQKCSVHHSCGNDNNDEH